MGGGLALGSPPILGELRRCFALDCSTCIVEALTHSRTLIKTEHWDRVGGTENMMYSIHHSSIRISIRDLMKRSRTH